MRESHKEPKHICTITSGAIKHKTYSFLIYTKIKNAFGFAKFHKS